MVARKPFCHRSYPETPSESDSAAAGVLRPPEPPPEVLATSAVAGKVAVDPPEFLAAAGVVAAAGSKSQLLRVVIPVAVVEDFGLRRKGLCDAFELWNLRFE
ncbi:uncharacterized protein DS421_19g656510 [Arachis hypogaea]|uniref:Uncharacterized protein n=1 Tax=Arachis hypogaea TaxID=3818 RepID=A0A6B9VAY1_ARAHY|nr:uncharacterized protein DS421_19g656510 [Arachis hypogaea]